jgi:hypothetical protein
MGELPHHPKVKDVSQTILSWGLSLCSCLLSPVPDTRTSKTLGLWNDKTVFSRLMG